MPLRQGGPAGLRLVIVVTKLMYNSSVAAYITLVVAFALMFLLLSSPRRLPQACDLRFVFAWLRYATAMAAVFVGCVPLATATAVCLVMVLPSLLLLLLSQRR